MSAGRAFDVGLILALAGMVGTGFAFISFAELSIRYDIQDAWVAAPPLICVALGLGTAGVGFARIRSTKKGTTDD
jgi:hypothetical protein